MSAAIYEPPVAGRTTIAANVPDIPRQNALAPGLQVVNSCPHAIRQLCNIFRSVVDVSCAVEVQNAMVERNVGVPEDRAGGTCSQSMWMVRPLFPAAR